jgi:hypothetical protein
MMIFNNLTSNIGNVILSVAKDLRGNAFEILRCAQDDMPVLSVLVVKLHHRVFVHFVQGHEDTINRVPTTAVA